MKTKARSPEQLPDASDDLRVIFYISDPASGSVPRVQFQFTAANPAGESVFFDHALSEYSTLTPAQKANLRAALLALRDETYTLEGFV